MYGYRNKDRGSYIQGDSTSVHILIPGSTSTFSEIKKSFSAALQ